ncbi:AMP-binding protein [Sorangium cellulosum]|nr:AMP-binding protein [Sorangium cellulosum]
MEEPRAPVPDPERLDLRAFVGTLRAGEADGAFLGALLPATYEAPERFRRALYAHAARRPGGLKSRPGEGYDVYHDCVVAHLGRRRRALVSVGAAGDQEVSYESLHLRAGALAAAWQSAGVAPGQAVAVVLPPSVEHVVALLAALRLGAVISALPPLGPAFVQHRLARLAPDHVVIAERHRHLAAQGEAALLPLAAAPRGEGAPPPSHWYAPDAPAARLLSVFGDPAAAPVELTAAALHEALLRDGLLVLGLDEADTLAAPGLDPAQHAPHLALAALAAGAACAEIAPGDAEADPRLLERAGVTVLGVSRRLRDAVLRGGAPAVPRSARAWFRSLTEVVEPERWDAFARALWARKVPGFGVAGAAAAAGVHLFSPPSPPSPTSLVPRVWPAPGRPWLLAELAAGALPALNAAGMYTPLRDGAPDLAGLPRLVLVREPDGFTLAGAVDVGRDAHAYPTAEVARVVEREPLVRHAAVVVSPGRAPSDAKITAIAFVEGERGPDGRVALPVGPRAIAARIAREMGEPFAPDRVEIFPLRPRLLDGVADEAWCRAQYLGGALHDKARSELFVLLSRLGYILARPPGAE